MKRGKSGSLRKPKKLKMLIIFVLPLKIFFDLFVFWDFVRPCADHDCLFFQLIVGDFFNIFHETVDNSFCHLFRGHDLVVIDLVPLDSLIVNHTGYKSHFL